MLVDAVDRIGAVRMAFNAVYRDCLFAVSITKMVWLATDRAKNFSGIKVCTLKSRLSSSLVRFLIDGDPCLMNALRHLKKVCINYL